MDPTVQALIDKVNKKYGDDTVILGERIGTSTIPRMPSGSLGVDVILGGGWPVNQWSEIIGNESMGKTTLALKTVAENQTRDPDWTCVWVAAEEFVPSWAKDLGVDLSRVIVINENRMEEAFQHVIDFAATKQVDGVIIDSLPALEPNRERDGLMEDFQPGLGAFVTGKFFRKSRVGMKRSLVTEERPILGLVINQWREKIGVMHGDPRTTPGGKAKNFHYFVRVEVSREEWITGPSDRKVGQVIRVKTMKNKSHPSQKLATVDFYFDDFGEFTKGDFDVPKDIINTALIVGTITRRGAFYYVGEERYQGRPALFEGLVANEALMDEVSKETIRVANLKFTGEDEPEPKKKRKVAKK